MCTKAPFVAGAEIAGERLALQLKQAGHDVFLVVGTDGDAILRFRSKGLRCYHVPTVYTGSGLGFRYRYHRRKIQSIFARERPDLIHSNDLPSHQIIADAARKLKIPVTCHHRWWFDQVSVDWFHKFGSNRNIFVSNWLMNEIASSSKTIITSNACVVHDGIPTIPMPNRTNRDESKRLTGLNNGRLNVMYVGQISQHKGVEDIIQAWDILCKRLPDLNTLANLVFVGEDSKNNGKYRRALESFAKSRDIEVQFAGFQNDLNPWYLSADINLVPSHIEPFGMVTAEAMMRCTPIIGTKVGGIPDVCIDQQNGILVPPKSPLELAFAIEELISSPRKRNEFGRSGRLRISEFFSIEKHTNRMLKIFESLF